MWLVFRPEAGRSGAAWAIAVIGYVGCAFWFRLIAAGAISLNGVKQLYALAHKLGEDGSCDRFDALPRAS
jgi:hypothetical protein